MVDCFFARSGPLGKRGLFVPLVTHISSFFVWAYLLLLSLVDMMRGYWGHKGRGGCLLLLAGSKLAVTLVNAGDKVI